jgi:hypothetical protein
VVGTCPQSWAYMTRFYANSAQRVSVMLKQRRVMHVALRQGVAVRQSKDAERSVSKRRKL